MQLVKVDFIIWNFESENVNNVDIMAKNIGNVSTTTYIKICLSLTR